jgi:hypothetical protein
MGPATLTTSRHSTPHDSWCGAVLSSSSKPTCFQNARPLLSARETSEQTRVPVHAVEYARGTCGALAASARRCTLMVFRRRVARPRRRKAGRTPSASTCTSIGGGGAPFCARSEVATRIEAAMQAMGLLDVDSVATRQRCVGCVRNW